MGWQGRIGDAVKVRGMFLHPRQVAHFMSRFPEAIRWQMVITRREHKDYLALNVVARPRADQGSLMERLARVARESIKFRLDVNIVSEDSLPPGASPVRDERTWE
jgi:phenylacetate-CoA ligase